MSYRPAVRSPYKKVLRTPHTGTFGESATSLPDQGNILARWSADDITPQTDNTKFTGNWTDAVGGFVASQASATPQPWYRTNRMGGKPSLEFRGAQTLNVGRPASIISAYNARTVSVFIVYKSSGTASTAGALALFGSHFLYADGTSVGNFNATVARGKTLPYSGQTSFSTFCATATTPDPTGGGTGSQRYAINGGAVTQNETQIAADDGSSNYAIGGDAGINFMFDGEIFDIIVWNNEITPTDIMQAQMWACDKYSQPYPWAAQSYFPIVDCNSHGAGVGATAFIETYPYKLAQSLGLSYGQWSNISTAGASMALMNTQAATNIDAVYALIGKPIRVAVFEWYNQRAASPTPRNSSLTYLSGRRNANVKVCFGTSTDTGETTDTNRADYNAYFDANHTTATMDSYVALHADANIGVEAAYVNFPANFVDTIGHMSDAGQTILAGLMLTGINAIT